MSNHPNRARAADARAVERLIAAAEKWAAARERSAASAARNGLANPRMMAAEDAALTAYIEARDAARARFAPQS